MGKRCYEAAKHRVFHCCPLKGSKAVTVKKREQLLQQPEEKNLAMRWGVYNKLALGHEECKRQGIPPTCSLQVRRRRTSAPCRGLEKAAKKESESIRRDPLLFQLAFSSSKIALMLSMDLLCL